jgi:iron complex transport system substrate-binding protein
MNIVSLLPSATEIVCALGLTDQLVGISHDCDYPPEIRGKYVLSNAMVSAEMPSAQIDTAIRDQIHTGKSVYHLDAERLAALRPDLILTQELCRVCAPSFTDVRRAARVLEGRTKIVSLEPHGLDDILETILEVGRLTGLDAAAHDLAGRLRARIERVRRRPVLHPRPRVACLEWMDPIFIAGHWVPEMVEVAGGNDGLGRRRKDSFALDWARIVDYAPEIIIVMPCGFDIARTRDEFHLLTGRPGWSDLPAVRARRVYLADASAYFSRPGPRIVTGVEILAEVFRAPDGPFHTEGTETL